MQKFDFTYYTIRSDEDCVFDDVEYPNEVNISHTASFSDDCRWPDIVREFGKFLESVGYVGAAASLSEFADAKWEQQLSILEKYGTDDEDTSNPGLSD